MSEQAATHPTLEPDEMATGDLAAHVARLVSRLARDELALAEIEAKQRAKRIGIGVGTLGAAAGAAALGGLCLIAAAVIGLSNVLRPWFAALVVAAGLFLVAGLIAMPGWKGIMQRRPLVVDDTVEGLKADVAVVRNAVRNRNQPNDGRHT